MSKLTFGRWLSATRKDAGMTQQSLGDAIGVSVTTVRNWERNEHSPSLNPSQTKALCNSISVSLDALALAFEHGSD